MNNESNLARIDDAVIDQIIEAQIIHSQPHQISAAEAYRLYQLEQRRQSDLRHQQTNDFVVRLAVGIGIACTGFICLLFLLAAVVSAFRPEPTPPPVINPNCWIGCRSEVPNAIRR
jgi:hypothetical protein